MNKTQKKIAAVGISAIVAITLAISGSKAFSSTERITTPLAEPKVQNELVEHQKQIMSDLIASSSDVSKSLVESLKKIDTFMLVQALSERTTTSIYNPQGEVYGFCFDMIEGEKERLNSEYTEFCFFTRAFAVLDEDGDLTGKSI